jgi:hypothetical protein
MTGVPGQPAFCPAGTGPCTGAPNPPTALADHTSTAIAGGSVLLAIALAQVLIVPSEFTTRRASRRAAPSPATPSTIESSASVWPRRSRMG